MNFHWGVALPNYGPHAERLVLVDTAQAAEDLGFDSVWLTDHVALPEEDAARFGRILEAITSLAYLAGVTQRIGLGLSALVLPQRNPVVVAKQLATADRLSGGRVRLAAALGWSRGEFANLGADFSTRARRLEEGLRLLRTLWRGPRVVSFAGEFYRVTRAVMEPPPLQPGGPPLWVAGNSPQALQRALFYADGWHPNARAPQWLAQRLQAQRAAMAARPFDVVLRIRLDFAAAQGPEGGLFGPPEQVARQLAAQARAGATGFVINFLAPTPQERLRAMRRFVEQVQPAFATLLAGGSP